LIEKLRLLNKSVRLLYVVKISLYTNDNEKSQRLVWLTEILGVPIIAFTLCVLFALLLYGIGRRMAPPGKKTKDKESSYACGEDVQSGNVQFYVHRFYYAVFFVIFESAAFIIFLGITAGTGGAITGAGFVLTLVYTILLLVALLAVPIWKQGDERKW
jgi:NADH:ubiquinone oxidoreductase subunit 3 (subunit A)